MVWVNKHDWLIMQEQNKNLTDEVINLREQVKEFEDDSGLGVIKRIRKIAKECSLDRHSKQFQDIMHRLFMDLGGRQSPVLKGYSQTTFVKDNDDETLQRVAQIQKDASIITRSIQDKSKKT